MSTSDMVTYEARRRQPLGDLTAFFDGVSQGQLFHKEFEAITPADVFMVDGWASGNGIEIHGCVDEVQIIQTRLPAQLFNESFQGDLHA